MNRQQLISIVAAVAITLGVILGYQYLAAHLRWVPTPAPTPTPAPRPDPQPKPQPRPFPSTSTREVPGSEPEARVREEVSLG
jgi:hypothetical protein